MRFIGERINDLFSLESMLIFILIVVSCVLTRAWTAYHSDKDTVKHTEAFVFLLKNVDNIKNVSDE